MVHVKICGIQTFADAWGAIRAGADALGFVFAPSKRKVDAEQVRSIIRDLPPFVCTVGVFVNEKTERITQIVKYTGLTHVQLHGDEKPEDCDQMVVPCFKTIKVQSRGDMKNMGRYQTRAIVLDSFVKGMDGGTGRAFDWGWVKGVHRRKPLILAGGLDAENVQQAIETVRPAAVDVSSGVETGGRKDPEKMSTFVRRSKAVTFHPPVGEARG